MFRLFFPFFLLLWICPLIAQQSLSGQVTDVKGEPLAFVNVLVDGHPANGGTTDINGYFDLSVEKMPDSLVFSYVGYRPLAYPLSTNDLANEIQVQLVRQQTDLTEVVVVAGENPAHRIIRRALANRDRHNPDQQKAYQCKTYNKLIVDIVANEEELEAFNQQADGLLKRLRTKRYNNVRDFHQKNDLEHFFLSETISEKAFRYPEDRQEVIIKNQVSGLKDPHFVSLANDIQPFAFAADQLDIAGKVFLNPINPGSTKQYFFSLEDTLYQSLDTVFLISFRPRKGKRFEGLKGVLYIHTRGYALQYVLAEPADKGLGEIRIEQKYQLLEGDRWFPEQLNFELFFPQYPDKLMGMRMKGQSYIYEVQLDQSTDFKTRNEAYVLRPEANSRSDSIWQALRPRPLSSEEQQTYRVIDSLGQKVRLENKIRLLESLITGRYEMGKIDLAVHRILRFNDYEGSRLGLGFYTNDQLHPRLSLGAYVGYGFQDSTWKYGGQLDWQIWPKKDLNLRLAYQDDIRETASPRWFFRDDLVQRAFFADQMDHIQQWSLALDGPLSRFSQFSIGLFRQSEKALYDYRFEANEDPGQAFDYLSFQLAWRWAYGERFVRMGIAKIRSGTSYPILEVNYTKGLMTKYGGDYSFDRINLALHQAFRVRALGQFSWRLEGGYVSPDVPYSRLFASSGIGRDFDVFVLTDNFQVTSPYEFVSDRYVHLFLHHRFLSPLYRSKWSQPKFGLAYHLGFGDLTNPNLHGLIDFQTMERGYMESGLMLEDVLRIPYLNLAYIGLGLAAFYRHGAYAAAEPSDNLAIRMSLNFSL
ncbi:MAG: DUF5686 family protein [Bacteroidota bacterium]